MTGQNPKIERIRFLIGKGHIEQAILKIEMVINEGGYTYLQDLIFGKSEEYAKLYSKIRKGVISEGEFDRKSERFINALLYICDSIVDFERDLNAKELSLQEGSGFINWIKTNRFLWVLGRFRQFYSFERTGLVGGSDVHSFYELDSFVSRVSGKRNRMFFSDQLMNESLKENLWVNGLADFESIGREILSRLATTFEFGHLKRGNLSIYDSNNGKEYSPRKGLGKESYTDYGLLIKTNNPFSQDKTLILSSGGWGTGNWGCGRVLLSNEFHENPIVRNWENFECLIEVDVAKGVPQKCTVVEIRKLPD